MRFARIIHARRIGFRIEFQKSLFASAVCARPRRFPEALISYYHNEIALHCLNSQWRCGENGTKTFFRG